MDRLARLRTRSSAGVPLNASTTSSLAAGYETANDESLTSGSGSMYFSMNEGNGTKSGGGEEEGLVEEEPTLSGTLATSGHHSGVDQTLENDFSVEEVSTIRKATIAVASPATVQVAAGMAVKYLGVSSTPAPKGAKKEDLSGFDQLEQTPSILKKMRDPKTPAESSFGEDPEESKATLDGSGIQGPPPGNKSYGTNVLANFFANLDVNPGTPAPPEIKICEPEVAATTGTTPSKRDSNSLENFFESLKKNPAPEVPAARPRKSLAVRKSLIPKVASMAAATKQNRVASPISRKPPTATAVRLLPEKLREMRKTQNDQLVQFRRKSVVPTKKSEEVVGDSVKVNNGGVRKSMAVATAAVKAVTVNPALKRKSVMPTTKTSTVVNGRKSVIPPAVPAVKRGVVSASGAQPRSVALKVPAKTTLSNGPDGTNNGSSTNHRRTLLGKRPATTLTVTSSQPEKLPTPTSSEQPPLAKQQRKSLAAPIAPVRVSPRNKPATAPQPPPQVSRIRPPSTTTGGGPAGFKKPETFTCDQCQRIFRLRSSFETHLKTVHQQQPSAASSAAPSPNKSADGATSATGVKCQYCGKGFAGAKFLANHVAANCVKIPLLEKRRLLAEGEAERAANVLKRTTPDLAKKRQSMMRPTANNRSASSTRSGDEETDTSSSSIGSGQKSRKRAETATGTVTGISRTPNKELKCHLCARRFLNAVEYALHVQAHAKNVKTGGGGDGEDVENEKVQLEQTEDVAKLVQKLATLKNRNGGSVKVAAAAAAATVLKSSNSNVGGK